MRYLRRLIRLRKKVLKQQKKMTAQNRYITSLLSVFSTFLESHHVSKDLALLTTEKFIVFINKRKIDDPKWAEHWSIDDLEKFLTAENVTHKQAVLLKKFVAEFTPLEIDIYLHEFLSSIKADNRSDSTIKNYRSDIQQFVSLSQTKQISNLFEPENLRNFVHNQLDSGLKLSTIKRKLSSISQFALWAETEKIVQDASFWISDLESLVTGKPNYLHKTSSVSTQNSASHQKNAQTEIENFLISLEIDGHSQATIKNYKSDLNQFFESTRESNLDKIITQENIENFVVLQRKTGLKPSSIKRKVTSITQFSLWAQERNLIGRVSSWIHLLQGQLFETQEVDTQDHSRVGNQTTTVSSQNAKFTTSTPQKFELKLKPNTLVHAHQANQTQVKHGWKLPVPDFAVEELEKKSGNTAKSNRELTNGEETRKVYAGIRSSLKEFANQINTKRNKQFLPYLNLVMMVVFAIGLGVLGYQQFIKQAPTPFAYPSTPVRPNRELSFQGRLTDTAQNPITTSTDMAFRLYDNSSGGTQLWSSGTCSVTPDQDGIFNVGLGDDCGSEITENVFTENSNVWLEVEIESETLDPRQSIKTVAYALNSETVQGYPVSATGAATTNTILTMDSGGQVLLGEVSPSLKANSGSFTIEAQALVLQTSSGSNGNITLAPDGTGKVIVQSDLDLEGYLHAPGATFSATYAGGTALIAKGGPSGTANIQEWQNSAGTVLSSVNTSGNVGIGTSNATALLELYSDANQYIKMNHQTHGQETRILFQQAGTTEASIGTGTGNSDDSLMYRSGSSQYFYVSTSELVMQLTAGGNGANRAFVGPAAPTTAASFGVVGFTGNSDIALVRFEHESSPTLDYLQIATNGSATGDIFAINSSGNVGIGSSSPGYKLDVVGNTQITGELNLTDAIRVAGNAGTSGYLLTSSGGGAMTWTDPASLVASTLWTNTLNVYHPTDEYASVVDLIIGGTSTASADIHLQSNGQAYFGGNVGIGSTAPGAKLEVSSTTSPQFKITQPTGSKETTFGVDSSGLLGIIPSNGIYLFADPGQASRSILAGSRTINNSSSVYGYNIDLHKTGSGGAAGILAFVYADASTTSTIDGSYVYTNISGAYSIGNEYGSRSIVTNNASSTVTGELIGIQSRLHGALGSVTGSTAFFQARNTITSGTIPNLYGLYVEALTQGTNNYAIYTAGTTQSYFGGNVGIGSSAPIGLLNVNGAATGKALTILNQTGNQAIFTASASGTTQFIIANDGNVGIGSSYTGAGRLNISAGPSGTAAIYMATNSTNSSITSGGYATRMDFGYNVGTGMSAGDISLIGGTVGTSRGVGVSLNYVDASFKVVQNAASVTSPVAYFKGGATPTADYFQIRSSAASNGDIFAINSSGNVGIGSSSPGYKLDVVGNTQITGELNLTDAIRIAGDAGTSGYLLTSSGGGANTWTDPDDITGAGWWENTLNVLHPKDEYASIVDLVLGGSSTASADIHLQSNGQAYFGGNVGIGTTNPTNKLELQSSTTPGLDLSSSSITHSVTTVLPADTFGRIGINNSSNGGLLITGIVNGGSTYNGALKLVGSQADNGNGAGRITFQAKTQDTGTSLGSNHVAFRFIDGDESTMFVMMGRGRSEFTATELQSGSVGAMSVNSSVTNIPGAAVGAFSRTNGSATPTGPVILGRSAQSPTANWSLLELISDYDGTPTTEFIVNGLGNVGIGSATPIGLLNIDGAATGKALAILNQTGNQDIFTASSSGTTRMRIANTGYVYAERFSDISNDSYYVDPAGSTTSMTLAGNAGIGTTTPGARLDVSGDLAANTATISATYAGGKGLVVKGGPSGTANIQEWQDSGGTAQSVVNSSGWIGIGSTAPTAPLNITTSAGNSSTGAASIGYVSSYTGGSTQNALGVSVYGIDSAASAYNAISGSATTPSGSSNTLSGLSGVQGSINYQGTAGTLTNGTAVTGAFTNSGAGTITYGTAYNANMYLSGSGNVAVGHGFRLQTISDTGGGSFQTLYGLYMTAITAASSNNYGIWGEAGDWILDEDGDGVAGGTSGGGNIILGEGQDLELYHDGTNSYIMNNTGNLLIGDVATDAVILSANGGNVGIGSSSPGYTLDLVGEFNLTDAIRVAGDAGTSGYLLTSSAGGAMTWTDPSTLGSGANLWANTLNVFHPKNEYASVVDLAIGGTSTASADIQLYSNGSAVFNEQGNDSDFRIEASGDPNAFFVQGSDGNIGLGTNTPSAKLQVAGSINLSGNVIFPITGDTTRDIAMSGSGTAMIRLQRFSGTDFINFYTNGTRKLYIGATIQPQANIIPDASNTYDLGSSSTTMRSGYFGTSIVSPIVYGGTGASSTLTLAGTSNGTPSNAHIILNGSNQGNVGIGTTTPVGKLNISGAVTGKALTILNETGDQAFLTASASGTTAFVLARDGSIYWSDAGCSNQNCITPSTRHTFFDYDIYAHNGGTISLNADGDIVLSAGGNVGIGSTSPGYALDLVGEFNLTDAIRVAGDAGTSGYVLTSSAGGANTWTDPSTLGLSYWANTLNVLHPKNEYASVVDITVGGTSTASADIQLYSNGSAVFNEQGNDSDFRIESDTNANAFFFQGSDGNIGLGTATPVANLNIFQNSPTPNQILFQIGTDADSTRFTVDEDGDVSVDNDVTARTYYAGNGTVGGPTFSFASDTNTGLYRPATDTIGIVTAGTEKVTIDANGNVGIGSTAPGYALDLVGEFNLTDAIRVAGNAGTSGYLLTSSGGGAMTWTDPASIATSATLWANTLNVLHPKNEYASVVDLVIGGTSTASADIQLYSNGSAVFNEQGNDSDFRIESDTNANAFFLDGLNANIGIGTNTTLSALQIHRTSSASQLFITTDTNVGSANDASLFFQSDNDGTPNPAGLGQYNDGSLRFTGGGSLVSPDMVITDAGNIGIGTTTPGQKLDVAGEIELANYLYFGNAGTEYLRWDSSNFILSDDLLPASDGASSLGSDSVRWDSLYVKGASIHIGNSGDEGILTYNTTDNYFGFDPDADATAEFVITSAGNVGVGTTAPTSFLLEVAGNIGPTADDTYSLGSASRRFTNIYSSGDIIASGISDADGDTKIQVEESADEDYIRFDTAGTERLVIDNIGKVGIGTATPTHGFEVNTAVTGKALVLLKELGDQDILTASNSAGVTRFRMANTGYLYAERFSDVSNSSYYVDPAGGTTSMVLASNAGIGTTTPGARLDVRNSSTEDILNLFDGSTEVFTVLDGGNVGIGSITPAAKLDIANSAGVELYFSGDTGVAEIKSDQDINFTMDADNDGSNHAFKFLHNASTELMRLTDTGNLGIGTTTPGARLDVRNSSTEDILNLFDGSTEVFTVLDGGNVGIGTTTTSASKVEIYGTSSLNDVQLKITSSDAQSTGRGGKINLSGLINGSGGQATFAQIAGLKTNSTADNTEGYFSVSTNNGANLTEKFRILGDGNVGIGSTAPAYKLQVSSGDIAIDHNQFYRATRSTSSSVIDILGFKTGTDTLSIKGGTSDANTAGIQFINTGNTPLVTIMGQGNVGIGTTTPDSQLHVAGVGRDSTPNAKGLHVGEDGSANYAIELTSNGGIPHFDFQNDTSGTDYDARIGLYGDDYLVIDGANVGIGTTSPGALLHLAKAGDSRIRMENTDVGGNSWSWANDWNALNGFSLIEEGVSGNVIFVEAGGNIGLSTSTPQTRLHVNGALTVGSAPVAIVTAATGDIVAGDSSGGFQFDASANDMYAQQSTANATGVHFNIRKSRGSAGSPSVVTTGDDILLLRAYGRSASSTWSEAGRITFDTEGTISGAIVPGILRFYTQSTAGSLTERMVIDSDGNVGIGSTSPGQKLVVNGNIQIGANGYIDDDATIGENSDDWISLNGYIELKSNTSSYGIVLREDNTTNYFGITQEGGYSILADTNTSANYFLRGNGPDVEVYGQLQTGNEVLGATNGYHTMTVGPSYTGYGTGIEIRGGNSSPDSVNAATLSLTDTRNTSSAADDRRWQLTNRYGSSNAFQMYYTPDNWSSYSLTFTMDTSRQPSFYLSDNQQLRWQQTVGASNYIELYSAEEGGNIGINYFNSSIKMKKNLEPLIVDSEKLYDLEILSYNYKSDPDGARKSVGLIAEWVDQQIPEIVAYESDGITPHHIMYGEMSVLILDQLQKLKPIIDSNAAKTVALNLNNQQYSVSSQSGQYVVTKQGSTIPEITVAAFAKAFIANIQAGLTNTKDLIVENTATIKNLSVENFTINGQSLLSYIQSVVGNQTASNNSTLISPVGNDTVITATNSGKVKFSNGTKTTAELTKDGNLSLLGNLNTKDIITNSVTASGSSILGSLLVQGDATVSGTLTAENSKLGNLVAQTASISGTLTTQNATVSGTVQAGTLLADQVTAASARISALEAGIAQLESVRATTADLVTATVSGTLYANSIYDFENKVATTLQQPGLLDILLGTNESTPSASFMEDLYATVNKTEFNASSSADLDLSFAELSMTSDDVVLTGSALFVEKYLKVNGGAYVSDSLAIGKDLFVGDSMLLADGLIRYTTADPANQILKIQPEGQGSIELLAGIVTIDDSGKVTVNGDLDVTGNAKIAGTLLTDMLKPTEFGNPLQVQVAGVDTQTNEVKRSRFEIINEVGTPVATFSAEGNAKFAGKVDVAGGLGIESQNLGSSDTNELSTNKTSGKATIKAGSDKVTIKSGIVTNDSLVYVTAVGSTDNKVLFVKSQAQDDPNTPENEGEFVVGFDSPASADVSFNWWIVN